MSIKKQLIYGSIFVSIVIVLPIQGHSILNDYKQFRRALGTAQHFGSDTSNIIATHKNHYLCGKYLKEQTE